MDMSFRIYLMQWIVWILFHEPHKTDLGFYLFIYLIMRKLFEQIPANSWDHIRPHNPYQSNKSKTHNNHEILDFFNFIYDNVLSWKLRGLELPFLSLKRSWSMKHGQAKKVPWLCLRCVKHGHTLDTSGTCPLNKKKDG